MKVHTGPRAVIGSTWENPRGDRFIIVEDHHENGYYLVRVQRSFSLKGYGELVKLDDSAMHAYCWQIETPP